jgi:hypothetical protein
MAKVIGFPYFELLHKLSEVLWFIAGVIDADDKFCVNCV